MIRGIIRIIISLFIGFLSCKGLYEIVFEDKDKMLKYEKLLNEGKSTTAYLKSEYKSVTYKKRDLNMNYIDYTFSVDNKEYSDSYFFTDINAIKLDTLSVFYLEEEPTFNAIDVQTKFDLAKKNYEEKTGLWLSIGGLIISLLLLFSGIRKVKK